MSRDIFATVKRAIDFQEIAMTGAGDNGPEPRRLWRIQKKIVEACERSNLVNIKGCHASGKTDVTSGIALQYLAKHPKNSRVFVTAPTQRQVKNFINEVELKRQRFVNPHFFPPCSALGMNISADSYLLGASSAKGVNIQGLHAEHVLIIVDEAPGLLPEIWDAIEGIRSGGNVKIIKLGNPVVPSGPFFEDFQNPLPGQENFTISAFDTPNLAGLTMERLLTMSDAELDVSVRRYLVKRRWVKEMYAKWGPNHPKFLARVLGQFPTQATNAVFLLEWLEAAKRDPTPAELEAAEGHFIQVGVDVAGGGDDETTAAARVDGIILEQGAWSEEDPFDSLLLWLNELRRKYAGRYRMGPVVMDVVGIGKHLGPRIAERGFDVVGFVAGARAIDNEAYFNQKSEVYWIARKYFQDKRISGLTDYDTRGQLQDILYFENNTGRLQIESKKDAREKRGVDSPDRAEAVIMALMPIVPRLQRQEVSPAPAIISAY